MQEQFQETGSFRLLSFGGLLLFFSFIFMCSIVEICKNSWGPNFQTLYSPQNEADLQIRLSALLGK